MLRLGVFSLKPLSKPASLYSTSIQIASRRGFSNLRQNGVLQSLLMKRPTSSSPGALLTKGSRTMTTDKPIITEAQGFSWQRFGITAVCLVH